MSWKEYEHESTENLIEYIQWRDQVEYKTIAEDAFRVLCFRFSEDVVKKCRIICKKWGYDNQISDHIAERTFNRFWKYPKTFTPSKCTKEINSCLKFYLYGIAQTQVADFKKEQSGVNHSPYTGNEAIVKDFPNLDALGVTGERLKDLKKKQELIEKALERLTPKHKIVYLTYKAHEISGHKMPRHLLKSLREELELAQASLQVYKKEANDTINEYLKIYGTK